MINLIYLISHNHPRCPINPCWTRFSSRDEARMSWRKKYQRYQSCKNSSGRW